MGYAEGVAGSFTLFSEPVRDARLRQQLAVLKGKRPRPRMSSQDCTEAWGGGDYADSTAAPFIHTNGTTGEVTFDVTQDRMCWRGRILGG